jgi:ABC-type molybdenum transport system ATPase subunit/photorepair protein PhrA
MLLVNRERFVKIADQLHHIWPHLKLLDTPDRRTLRPRFQLDDGKIVLLEDLSAGERAALIAFFTIARWLTPGGVVLLDEPELHQHLSMMRTNLAVIEDFVVRQMGGQLIIASHAPEVWDRFHAVRLLIDLNDRSPKPGRP